MYIYDSLPGCTVTTIAGYVIQIVSNTLVYLFSSLWLQVVMFSFAPMLVLVALGANIITFSCIQPH